MKPNDDRLLLVNGDADSFVNDAIMNNVNRRTNQQNDITDNWLLSFVDGNNDAKKFYIIDTAYHYNTTFKGGAYLASSDFR
jgi:hypothetical protein